MISGQSFEFFLWTVARSLTYILESLLTVIAHDRLHISTAQKDSYPIYMYTDFSYVP